MSTTEDSIHYKMIMDNTNDFIVFLKADYIICHYSRKTKDTFKNISQLNQLIKSNVNSIQKQKSFVTHIKTENNEEIIIYWKVYNQLAGPDIAEQIILIGSDITEKKGLEEKIFNLDFIIKKVPGYVFWKDINSTLLGCNENFAYKAGLEKPEDIVGKTDYDLPWDKNEAENYVRDDQEVIRTGKPKLHIEETQ